MNTHALDPYEIDLIEIPKIAAAFDWLVEFVNQQLEDSTYFLADGNEVRVHFSYSDFIHHYEKLKYWRAHYREIAQLFRENGWDVTEYASYNPMPRRDEEQPSLGFRLRL